MPTQCNAEQLEFSCVERRRVVAAFEGGMINSNAGSLLLGKLSSRRRGCAALAGKSTLNRLELHPSQGVSRHHKVRPEGAAIEGLFVELFLDADRRAPREIVLDLDATDAPLHGHQEGRFFHGYYDSYCYLPLYIFSASTCCWRSYGRRTSMAWPGREKKSSASLARSAPGGRRPG